MVQYGSGRRGGGKTSVRGMQLPATTDPASMYEALKARSNVETDADRGFLDALLDNPIFQGAANLIPGGQIAATLGQQGLTGRAANLTEEGEGNRIYGPASGVMNNIFDLLSRGQYASASMAASSPELGLPRPEVDEGGFVDQLLGVRDVGSQIAGIPFSIVSDVLGTSPEGKPNTLAEGVAGLAGKNKISYAQVLEQEGVENPLLQHGAGFAYDILADPTTYLGVGKTAPVGAGRALKEAVDSGGGQALINGTSAVTPQLGSLNLNLVGMPLIRSEKAYQIGKRITEPISRSQTGQWFNKAFRQSTQLPEGLHDDFRRIETARVRELDLRVADSVKTLKQLSPTERETLQFALDEGTDLSHVPTSAVLPDGSQAASLEEVKQWVKGMYDRLWEAEQASAKVLTPQGQLNLGMSPGYVQNYTYKTSLKDSAKKIPKGDKRTLQQLIQAGYEVETDALNSLVQRIGKAERTLTKSSFDQHIYDAFGIDDALINPQLRQQYDLVKYRDKWIPRHIEEARTYTNTVMASDEVASKLVRGMDNVLKEWKFLATAANPGHNIRNLISDAFMNAQDGTLPWSSAYGKARRVLFDRTNMVMEDTLGVAPGQGVVPEVYKPGATLKTSNIGGVPVPQDKLWQAFVDSGGKSGFQATELHRTAEALAKTGPYSHFRNKVGDFANAREDYARLAHFIDVLDKKGSRGKPLFKNGQWTQAGREAINEAGSRVRKWNLDYGSLTPFERKYMRRMMPFYSFMRFNIPRQIELLATRPGFMALYPKGQNLLQGIFGTDDGEDTLLPDWIRESAPFRLQKEAQEQRGPLGWLLKGFGVQPGQQAVFGGTGFLPIGDLERFQGLASDRPVQESWNRVLNDLTPFAKIPAELGTGRSLYTGDELGTGFEDYLRYGVEQIPLGRQGSNIAGGSADPIGGFARYLTGMPIRGVTEGQQAGEFRRREDIINALFNREMGQAGLPAGLDDEQRRRLFRAMQGMQQGG